MTNSFLQRLQRWLDGTYRLSDEQAMQKLTREDDFVRESFEGYLGIPEEAHEERLARLRTKIKAPAEPLVVHDKGGAGLQKWMWAASIALLVGVFWFFRTQHLPESSTPMATNADKTVQPEGEAELAKSKTEVAGDDLAAAPAEKNAPTARHLPPVAHKEIVATQQDDEHGVTAVEFEDHLAPSPATSAENMGNSAGVVDAVAMKETTAEQKADESKVLDMDKARVGVVPSVERSKFETADVAMTEKAAKKAGKDKNKRSAASKPSAPGVTDGVVFHETDRKKNEQQAEGDLLPAHPEPMGGMEAYRDYLRTALRKPDAALQANVRGKVGLRFSVNKDGRPIQIVTTKSLGYGCNEEAIRLVLEGTFWTPGQDNVVELEIEF